MQNRNTEAANIRQIALRPLLRLRIEKQKATNCKLSWLYTSCALHSALIPIRCESYFGQTSRTIDGGTAVATCPRTIADDRSSTSACSMYRDGNEDSGSIAYECPARSFT